MSSKPRRDVTVAEKERISELYADGRSASEIAFSIDRSRYFVRYWMDKLGLDTSANVSQWREIEARAVTMKRAGETTEGIARTLAVNTATIRSMLARNGLTEAPPPPPIALDEAKRLLRLYEAGVYKIHGLCRMTGRGRRAVNTALERARTANRPGPNPQPRARSRAVSQQERARIREAYLAGTSIQDLVTSFGRSENTIYKITRGLRQNHRVEPDRMVRLRKRGHSIAGIARYDKISERTVRRKLAAAGIGSTQPLKDGLALVEAGVSLEEAAERVVCAPSQLRGAVRRAARTRQAAEVQRLRAEGVASGEIAARLGPRWTRADVEKLLTEAADDNRAR